MSATAEPAAPGYPGAYEADAVLSDGGTVHVRPVRPDDAERVVAMHARLSDESKYLRFFTPRPTLTEREVEAITRVDYTDRFVLVALLGDDLIAVARYDRFPGRGDAEVAFTVEDAHQGRGLASMLLELLAARANEVGVERFTAEVLHENRSMLRVFRKAGWETRNEFAGGIIEVEFDISPSEASLAAMEAREHQAESRSVARLLNPRSIAVIGAGRELTSLGRAVVRNLVDHGFDGPVYPINPHAEVSASIRTWPSVLDVPDQVDLAILAVRASSVLAAVEECARKHVRAVVVVTTGFREAGGPDADTEAEVVELARRHGMRLVGPASLGFVVTAATPGGSALHASFTGVHPPSGRIAVSSQSGTLGAAIMEAAGRAGLGISTFVSLGDKGDLSGNDLLQHWQDDPRTDVVLMYTESFGNPRKFSRIARRVSKVKPVVAVTAGAGSPLATDSLYQRAGVIRVGTVAELLGVAAMLSGQPLPAGRRVAVVTNSTSPGVLAVGAMAAAGLALAELSEATRAQLEGQLPEGAVLANPLDLGHRAMSADYERVVPVVRADPGVDAVLVVNAPPVMPDADNFRAVLGQLGAQGEVPLVAVALGVPEGMAGDAPRQVPVFTFPEAAVAALGRVARYAAWKAAPAGEELEPDGFDAEAAATIVATALARLPGGGDLTPDEAAALLGAAGVPFAPARVATDAAQAVAAAAELGFPVVVKAVGRRLPPRAARAGVVLDLHDGPAVAAAQQRLAASFGEALDHVVVQRMAPLGVELLVEASVDPSLGPLVSFGLGGAYAELIGDRTSRLTPLTDLDVAELVGSSRAGNVVTSVPGGPGALADVLGRVAALAEAVPDLSLLRLNPVLLSEEGAWAVDVHARVDPGAGAPRVLGRLL